MCSMLRKDSRKTAWQILVEEEHQLETANTYEEIERNPDTDYQ